MTYQQKLRFLRGDRLQERVARDAEVSRATIINAESETEQLKFKTIAQIVRALGYPDDSVEMREVALLWLESVSGIHFGAEDAAQAIAHIVHNETVKNRLYLDALSLAIAKAGLSPTEIQILTWAATRAPALEILSHARQLEGYSENNDTAQLPVPPKKTAPAAGDSRPVVPVSLPPRKRSVG